MSSTERSVQKITAIRFLLPEGVRTGELYVGTGTQSDDKWMGQVQVNGLAERLNEAGRVLTIFLINCSRV
jgi:hypothetical protein